MKQQEVGISIVLNGVDEDNFMVVIDVPDNFENWNYDKQYDYLQKNIDRIEKKAKKEMYISLSRFHSPI